MFLGHIGQIGLLVHSPDTNIIAQWPLPVRRILVSEVVKFLNEPQNASLLVTATHVTWAMELIGQSFALPISDHEIINMGIDIYTRWLATPQRPAPVAADEETFFNKIFHHFSFLFEARASNASESNKHIGLCNKALGTLVALSNQREQWGDAALLPTECWHTLLRVLVGICDANFRGPKAIPELNYNLLKVTFEVYLRSHTRDEAMWTNLQTFAARWTHHKCLIEQWNSVCMALSRRVVRILFGQSEGTQVVHISWAGGSLSETKLARLPESYVFFSWYQMLHVLGNPNNIKLVHIHYRAFRGILDVIELLCAVGTPPAVFEVGMRVHNLPHPPDGNSILRIFGPWLFECVSRDIDELSLGRAVAFKCLCKIFCRRTHARVNEEDLCRFYEAMSSGLFRAISRGFGDNELLVVSSILTNSDHLFAHDLEGSHLLIPRVTSTVREILLSSPGGVCYSSHLRRASITMIASLSCVPNHFLGMIERTMAMPEHSPAASEESGGSEIVTGSNYNYGFYHWLKQEIVGIVSSAIEKECDPRNLQMLLWTALQLMTDDLSFSPADNCAQQILGVLVRLLRNVTTLSNLQFPNETQQPQGTSATTSTERGSGVCGVTSDPELGAALAEAWVLFGPSPTAQYGGELYSFELVSSIFGVLEILSKFYDKLCVDDEDCAPRIVSELCTFINSLLTSVRSLKKEKVTLNFLKVVCDSLYCMLDWFMVAFEDLMGSEGVIAMCLATIEQCLNVDRFIKKTEKINDAQIRTVAESASVVLAFLLNHVGMFPPPNGPATMASSCISEEDFLPERPAAEESSQNGSSTPAGSESSELLPLLSPYSRFFILDNTFILSLIDHPVEHGGPGATLILRDVLGKYAWDTHQVWTNNTQQPQSTTALLTNKMVSLAATSDKLPLKSSTTTTTAVTAVTSQEPAGRSPEIESENEGKNGGLVKSESDVSHLLIKSPVLTFRPESGTQQPLLAQESAVGGSSSRSGSGNLQFSLRVASSSQTAPKPTLDEPEGPTNLAPPPTRHYAELNEDQIPPMEPHGDQTPTAPSEIRTDAPSTTTPTPQSTSPLPPSTPEKAESVFIDTGFSDFENSKLLAFAKPVPRGVQSDAVKTMNGVFATCAEKGESTEKSSAVDSRSAPAEPPRLPDRHACSSKFQVSRQLMSHLNFLSVETQNRLVPLVPSVSLLRTLRRLDQRPCREAHKIGVIYVQKGQEEQGQIFMNQTSTPLYNEFLHSLGWMIDLASHPGYMGGLDPNLTTGTHAPYYADHTTECVFHAPTMMPNKEGDSQQIHKKRHVGNDHVRIVWSEHVREYKRDTISSQFNFVHVVVYPMENGLFRIQTHTKDIKDQAIPFFGPVFDGMVLSKALLGPLVRWAAINANRAIKKLQADYTKVFSMRKKDIEDIAKKFKDEKALWNFYGSVVQPKPTTVASR